jgi:lipoprotein-anchoring transpeptidase ErfK/SrfK
MLSRSHVVPGYRRQRGGALVHALAFLAGATLGWLAWPFAVTGHPTAHAAEQPTASPQTTSSISPANLTASLAPTAGARQAPPAILTSSNGALIIPVKDASGTGREPMVLLPIQARTRRDPGRGPAESAVTPTNLLRAGTNTDLASSPRVTPSTIGSSTSAIANRTTSSPGAISAAAERIVQCQVGLARRGFSPGSIDGLMGSQTRAALRAWQQREGWPRTDDLGETNLAQFCAEQTAYTNYVITAEDRDRLLPLSPSWLGKSQQARLDFESLLELVAERSCTHPNLIRRLNPTVDWNNASPGTTITVPAAQTPEMPEKAAYLRIRLAERTLQVFGAASNLLAHFPCSIAQRVEKRPVGEPLQVAVLAPDPNYTFDPAVFPESAEARELGRKLILQPGPNNPVGSVWIGLDKPGYGIHGTPKPEEVGRTESHGCFRLANWNARLLLQLVTVGTPVEVMP